MNIESALNIRPYRIFEDQIGAGKKKKGFYILKKGRRQYVNRKIIVHKKKYKRTTVTPRLLTKINSTNRKVVGDILKNNLSKSSIGKLSQDVFKNIKGDVSKVGEVNTTYNIQKDVGDIKKVINEAENYNKLGEKVKKAQNNVIISNATVRDSKKLLRTSQAVVLDKFKNIPEIKAALIAKYPNEYDPVGNKFKISLVKGNKAGLPLWNRTKEILRDAFGEKEGKAKAARDIYNFEKYDLVAKVERGEDLPFIGDAEKPAVLGDVGAGEGMDLKGMDNNQIDKVMRTFKKTKYVGTMAYDELWELLKTTTNNDFCCIFNSVERDNKIVGHWIAFNCDKKTRSIEVFDSFGDDLGRGEWEKIMAFTNRVSPEIAWEYKPNAVQQQNDKTDTCGWFCIKFLLSRRINGISFENATGFSNISKNEKEILKLKNQFRFL